MKAPRVLSKHLWAVPLLAALVFSLVGLWVRSRVEETTRAELAARLQTVLQADINALRLWFTERQYDAKSFASDMRIQAAIAELAALAKDSNTTAQALTNSAAARTLQLHLQPLVRAQDYTLLRRRLPGQTDPGLDRPGGAGRHPGAAGL